jgi:hypothetical protein
LKAACAHRQTAVAVAEVVASYATEQASKYKTQDSLSSLNTSVRAIYELLPSCKIYVHVCAKKFTVKQLCGQNT